MQTQPVDAEANAAVERPSTALPIYGVGEAFFASMIASDDSQFALCVVCERPLYPGRYVLYEIGGLSLTQHLSCFSRGIIHGYRVLNPSSTPVVVRDSCCRDCRAL